MCSNTYCQSNVKQKKSIYDIFISQNWHKLKKSKNVAAFSGYFKWLKLISKLLTHKQKYEKNHEATQQKE